MKFRIQFQSEALVEMQEAYYWYETQKTGLGNEFMEEVESVLQKLSENPQHYSQVNPRFRRARLKRFPYKLLYEISDDTVIITRVRHEGQKPIA